MTYADLIAHFGGVPETYKALKIDRQLLLHWRHNGIPMGRQALIQLQTRGKLRADPVEAVKADTNRA